MSKHCGIDAHEMMWLYEDIAAFESSVARYGAAFMLDKMSINTRKELEKALGHTSTGSGKDEVRKVSGE